MHCYFRILHSKNYIFQLYGISKLFQYILLQLKQTYDAVKVQQSILEQSALVLSKSHFVN